MCVGKQTPPPINQSNYSRNQFPFGMTLKQIGYGSLEAILALDSITKAIKTRYFMSRAWNRLGNDRGITGCSQ